VWLVPPTLGVPLLLLLLQLPPADSAEALDLLTADVPHAGARLLVLFLLLVPAAPRAVALQLLPLLLLLSPVALVQPEAATPPRFGFAAAAAPRCAGAEVLPGLVAFLPPVLPLLCFLAEESAATALSPCSRPATPSASTSLLLLHPAALAVALTPPVVAAPRAGALLKL